MNIKDIDEAIEILQEYYKGFKIPIVTDFANKHYKPFHILISTVISLRTKDEVTSEASARLFEKADNPKDMLELDEEQIQKLIFPAGFYKTKAKNILRICRILVDKYNSKTPDDLDELLSLPGVGRKTANLVITLGYNKDGICVDTHVHRISNRFGIIKTKTPEKTEFALREILPRKYWIIYNDLLVAFGQNHCKPISPFCSKCRLDGLCSRIGVEKHR